MNYKSIRTILYESEEILDIPDKWQEALPILAIYQDEFSDVFIYFTENEMVEIKRAIIISISSGNISVLTTDEIQTSLGVTTKKIPSKKITDYDEYFAKKDEYERIYEQAHDEFISNPHQPSTLFQSVGDLYKTVMGNEFYNDIYKNITAK